MLEDKKHDRDFWDLKALMRDRSVAIEGGEKEIPVASEKPRIGREKIDLTKVNDSYFERNGEENASYFSEKLDLKVKPTEKILKESDTLRRPLILKTEIAPSSSGYSSSFARHAEKYWNAEARETPFVDFYAFSPTYANFSAQSFGYYLWWRANFREGKLIRASWSHLSIFISEIINCRNLVSPEDGIALLWRIFDGYSDAGSELYISDVLCKLPEIICDYSLVNSLSIPDFVTPELVVRASRNARLREVFFEGGNEMLFAKLLVSSCSEYEFSGSKFSAEIFNSDSEENVLRALLECIRIAKKENMEHPLAGVIKEVTTVSRHSYSNYVYVSPENLCVITVSFCSVNRSYTLRNSISGIVKQCENNIRAVNGIKPRLKVFSLEPVFRDTVDSFFERLFPPNKRKKVQKKSRTASDSVPEYEKYYDNERVGEFSLEEAKRIEERSWNVVEKLTLASDGDTDAEDKGFTENEKPSYDDSGITQSVSDARESSLDDKSEYTEELQELLSACPDCAELIFALYRREDTVIDEFVRAQGVPLQVLCDRINEASFDVIGDILVEPNGEKYEIISEYEYIFGNPI